MTPIRAVYVRMNNLLSELGSASTNLYQTIVALREQMQRLGISWVGAANDAYMRRLMEDMYEAEMTAVKIIAMHEYLYRSIEGYQKTETEIGLLIGDMRL